mmetsp:Transcript_15416/g.27701  ORF Transcript_15416/g.27701 Transcript_15416/m.27701 type:complete len:279 (+) Transcript_15416:2852-3688(+)
MLFSKSLSDFTTSPSFSAESPPLVVVPSPSASLSSCSVVAIPMRFLSLSWPPPPMLASSPSFPMMPLDSSDDDPNSVESNETSAGSLPVLSFISGLLPSATGFSDESADIGRRSGSAWSSLGRRTTGSCSATRSCSASSRGSRTIPPSGFSIFFLLVALVTSIFVSDSVWASRGAGAALSSSSSSLGKRTMPEAACCESTMLWEGGGGGLCSSAGFLGRRIMLEDSDPVASARTPPIAAAMHPMTMREPTRVRFRIITAQIRGQPKRRGNRLRVRGGS